MYRRFGFTSFVCLCSLATFAVCQDDDDYNPCQSWGVDFQPGGSYFQNASSTDQFSFVSLFEGCQDDFCSNILVDPAGDEYLCSDTNLSPDDTDQLSTCPIEKDQMYSGEWSVLLISNNGDAEPIAYERDFYLSVGVPSTVTYTPTVTLSVTVTPIRNVTTTQTATLTNTITSTIVSPAVTRKPTVTVTPHRVTVTKTITMGTISKTKYTAQPTFTTKTITQTCSIPPRQRTNDPPCTITPTLISAAALSSSPAESTSTAAAGRRRDIARRVSGDRELRVAERKARLAADRIEERGLDASVTTVTDQNTADYPITTVTSSAPTSTMLITTQVTTTLTTTSKTTIFSGTTTLSQITITAPTPTRTQTRFTVITTTVATVTKHPTITITKHTAPVASTKVCTAKGGKMV